MKDHLVPDTARLNRLTTLLATQLHDRYGIEGDQASLEAAVMRHAASMAAAQNIAPQLALTLMGDKAIVEVAAQINQTVHDQTVPDTDPDTLNSNSPLNAVALAHVEPGPDEHPALHVVPEGTLSTGLLNDLLGSGQPVWLTIEDLHETCTPEDHHAGPHQHVRLHLNPGPGYGHDGCIVLAVCVGCAASVIDTILVEGHGWVRRYVPEGHRWVGQAEFQLANPRESLAAVAAARQLLTD